MIAGTLTKPLSREKSESLQKKTLEETTAQGQLDSLVRLSLDTLGTEREDKARSPLPPLPPPWAGLATWTDNSVIQVDVEPVCLDLGFRLEPGDGVNTVDKYLHSYIRLLIEEITSTVAISL
uniref:Uncharacterized protein n=1 Tax=Sphaerodactylus townsendi TaxID=933632 RepID=A0ACB8F107_9SAUR